MLWRKAKRNKSGSRAGEKESEHIFMIYTERVRSVRQSIYYRSHWIKSIYKNCFNFSYAIFFWSTFDAPNEAATDEVLEASQTADSAEVLSLPVSTGTAPNSGGIRNDLQPFEARCMIILSSPPEMTMQRTVKCEAEK